MDYLFEPDGLSVLRTFANVRCLYVFDFDGTLAPIVSSPGEAKLPETVKSLLIQLNDSAPVAILTGRGVSDVRNFLPIEPSYIIGNHGSEGLQGPEELAHCKKICGAWMELLSDYLEPYFGPLGIYLENKMYSLSLHFRNSAEPERALQVALAILQKLPGAQIIHGKMVLNVLPANALNKGLAFSRLLQEGNFKHGLYVGDDDTDEDVFNLKDPMHMTIRVGHSSTSSARFYINDQREIGKLLENLLAFSAASFAT